MIVSEIGVGNSGGFVFDKDGKVIVIFVVFMIFVEGVRIIFVILIKYGLDLMYLILVI